MSDIWAGALTGLIQQMRDKGYSGLPTIAVGVGAVYGMVNAVKGDWQRGDYAAVAVDGGLAVGTAAAAALVVELGSTVIAGAALGAAAEALSYIALGALGAALSKVYNSAFHDDAAKLALILNIEAKALAHATEDAAGVILDGIVQKIGDLLSRLENGYYDDQIPEIPDNQNVLSKAWNAFTSRLDKELHDPLVLDLGGDGVALSSVINSGVHFDFSGDGLAEQTAWIGPNEGILAIDDNGNGLIDNGLELFGSATQDGFAVLETLDSNQDGIIDAHDEDFGKLRIWKDANQNGISDPGELQTLPEAGVTSISLNRRSDGSTNAGNTIGYSSSFIGSDGASHTIESVYLQIDQRHPAPDETSFTVAPGVESYRSLPGRV